MANETLGTDLKIYKPLFKNTKRQLKGLSTKQGQAEFENIGNIMRSTGPGEAQAGDTTAGSRIANLFGNEISQSNIEDLATRRQRALNKFNSGLYQSERRFIDAVKTQGLENALGMFQSQLESQTKTNIASIDRDIQQNQVQQNMGFIQKESELDRILAREQYQADLSISNMQRKRDERSSKFNFLGNLLGNVVGFGLGRM